MFDKEVVINEVELENVHDFRLIVNCETMDLENEVKLMPGDEIEVRITREDDYKKSVLTLVGYDPNEPIAKDYVPESQLDEIPVEEDIYVSKDETVENSAD